MTGLSGLSQSQHFREHSRRTHKTPDLSERGQRVVRCLHVRELFELQNKLFLPDTCSRVPKGLDRESALNWSVAVPNVGSYATNMLQVTITYWSNMCPASAYNVSCPSPLSTHLSLSIYIYIYTHTYTYTSLSLSL